MSIPPFPSSSRHTFLWLNAHGTQEDGSWRRPLVGVRYLHSNVTISGGKVLGTPGVRWRGQEDRPGGQTYWQRDEQIQKIKKNSKQQTDGQIDRSTRQQPHKHTNRRQAGKQVRKQTDGPAGKQANKRAARQIGKTDGQAGRYRQNRNTGGRQPKKNGQDRHQRNVDVAEW